ncbi:MAG: Ig-like domain-containing protein, partial [Rhodoglobus sp.]|nr:Ig-like domain-containing protein [Rhodoglobus sp.]
SVEFFLNDVSIGTAVREQTTNIYRLAYDFSRFDFSTAPSITDPNTGVTRYTPIPVYAIARDSNDNQTVSARTNLTINPSTSSPPSLQLQALSQTTITQGQQFFILPNFADLDGSVTQIQLFANGTAAAGGTINNPQPGQILTYTPTTAGRFNLFAVATDDSGNTVVSSPSIVVTVNAVAAPTTTITRPADNDTTTTVGAPVFLEGTATSPNPTFVPTLQFIITGSGGGRQTINGIRVGTTTTYRAIWNPTTADTFTVSTQANIGTTASGTSTVSRRVIVSNLIGLAPTVSITSPPTTTTTASTINLTATATDSDGSVVEVEFFLNRNSIGLATRDQLANTWRITASFAGVPLGASEVVARARDSSGNVAASTTISINVTAASSIAPSITITPSTVNAAFNRQVQLRANARDTDGTVSSVQYFANNASLGTSTNAGASYQV